MSAQLLATEIHVRAEQVCQKLTPSLSEHPAPETPTGDFQCITANILHIQSAFVIPV
jgi:hypothetical protein